MLRFWEAISKGVRPKWSATTWIMVSAVIFRPSFGEIMSFKASSARAMVISLLWSNLDRATIFVRAPSSSRMLDLMLVAMYFMTFQVLFFSEDGHAGLVVGGLYVHGQAPFEAGAETLLKGLDILRRFIGGYDNLFF